MHTLRNAGVGTRISKALQHLQPCKLMRMLVGRRPTLAAIASVTAPAKAPQKSQSTMAQATTRTIWVKGDPNKQELGDCPFCHRSLLTLELKVRVASIMPGAQRSNHLVILVKQAECPRTALR